MDTGLRPKYLEEGFGEGDEVEVEVGENMKGKDGIIYNTGESARGEGYAVEVDVMDMGRACRHVPRCRHDLYRS